MKKVKNNIAVPNGICRYYCSITKMTQNGSPIPLQNLRAIY